MNDGGVEQVPLPPAVSAFRAAVAHLSDPTPIDTIRSLLATAAGLPDDPVEAVKQLLAERAIPTHT